MTPATRTVGKVPLLVAPGRDPVVLVHEIGGELRLRHQGAPWRYVQRGHAGSGWSAGRVYHTSDFVLDLLRLLRTTFTRPVRLEGWGVGGLVAVLAATAEPRAVESVGLHASHDGWSRHPERVLAPTAELNGRWLELMRAGSDERPSGQDPMLAVGPPTPLPLAAVSAATEALRVPWWSSGDHPLETLLPRALRTGPT